MDLITLALARKNGSSGGVSSWNDLTDKPFEDTRKFEEIKIEWDGNTDGLVTDIYDSDWYKVSELIPTFDEMRSATMTLIWGGEIQVWSALHTNDAPEADYAVYFGGDNNETCCVVVKKTTEGFPEAGLYFTQWVDDDGQSNYVSSLTYTSVTGEIKTLDPKFLPEGARAYKAVENVCFVDNESRTSVLDSTYGAYAVYLNMVLEKMYRTEPCIVTWDGTTKTHNPVDMELMGTKFTAYGNVGMFAAFGVPAENTGEPYVLVVMENGYSFFFTADMAATNHTISVTGKSDVYHKLDQVYLGIPTIDLIELGVSAVSSEGYFHGGATDIDTSGIVSAVEKGIVKLRFNVDSGDGGINPVESFALGTENRGEWLFLIPHDASGYFLIAVNYYSVSIHKKLFAN